MKLSYNLVAKANKKSHAHNKRYYDRRTKQRKFSINDLVYLYNPAFKQALSKKFSKKWRGPYRLSKKITDLNYEITDPQGKKQVVHTNRLKRAYNSEFWTPQQKQKTPKQKPKRLTKTRDDETNSEFRLGHFPLRTPHYAAERIEPEPPDDNSPHTPHVTPQPIALLHPNVMIQVTISQLHQGRERTPDHKIRTPTYSFQS